MTGTEGMVVATLTGLPTGGLVCIGMAVRREWRTARRARKGCVADAEIVGLLAVGGSPDDPSFLTLVEFRDGRGELHRIKSKSQPSPAPYKVGQALQVSWTAGAIETGSALIDARQSSHEARDRFEHLRRAVAVGRMARAGQLQQLDVSGRAGDPVDLLHGAVLVVLALDGQDRAGDARQGLLDRPAAEPGAQPDVVPAAEGAVDVVVVSGQARAQVAAVVCVAGGGDGGHRDVLDHDVGREQDEGGDAAVAASGMDQGDRPAVAVPEEDRPPHSERVEELGQHDQRFVVHEAGGARSAQRRGAAVPVPRVGEHVVARGPGDLPWEVPPHRDRAQAFVEHDDLRPAAAARDALVLDAAARHRRQRHGRGQLRSLKRWILPVAVMGSSVLNSTHRGYL
jgi:hypothetical protein